MTPRPTVAGPAQPASVPAGVDSEELLLARSLPLLLLKVREAVLRIIRPHLNQAGVTEQQWRVLLCLLEHGPMEQKDVGRHCHITSPSLAGVLARMQKASLIERRRLTRDQRRMIVSLTGQGQTRSTSLLREIRTAYAALGVQVGGGRLLELYTALDDLRVQLEPGAAFSPLANAQVAPGAVEGDEDS